jgi:hypothetical protein
MISPALIGILHETVVVDATPETDNNVIYEVVVPANAGGAPAVKRTTLIS